MHDAPLDLKLERGTQLQPSLSTAAGTQLPMVSWSSQAVRCDTHHFIYVYRMLMGYLVYTISCAEHVFMDSYSNLPACKSSEKLLCSTPVDTEVELSGELAFHS